MSINDTIAKKEAESALNAIPILIEHAKEHLAKRYPDIRPPAEHMKIIRELTDINDKIISISARLEFI